MKQRMRYVFVLALATSGIVVSACSGDDTSGDDQEPSAGASGTKAGGSSAGGSASKAGDNSGGEGGSAMAGTSTTGGSSVTAGAGGAADAGMAGANDAGAGGNHAGAAGSAGAAGMGGAGEPALVYACGSATLIQKKCSALFAANCTLDGSTDNTTVCSDCVAQATSDREAFQTDPPCDTCNAKWDAIDQCEVDAFESGTLTLGVECFDGYADGTDSCYATLNDAIACESYVGDPQNPQACPATWPPQ